MRKACLKRVLCYACCLSLVLGVFAYKPAKAEAVFVSPMASLGASFIGSVVSGTTASFFVETGAADAIGSVVDFLLDEYISVMDELTGHTPETICELVGSGAVSLGGTAIQLSAPAGEFVAGFIYWLQNVKGFFAGGPSMDFTVEGDHYASPSFESLGLPPLWDWWVDDGYAIYLTNNSSSLFGCRLIVTRLLSDVLDDKYVFQYVGYPRDSYEVENGDWSLVGSSNMILGDPGGIRWYDFNAGKLLWTNFNIYSADDAGNRYIFYQGDGCSLDAGYPEEVVSLSPRDVLISIPNVLPDYSALAVDLPVDISGYDDAEAAADAIFESIANGEDVSVSVELGVTDIPGTSDDVLIVAPGADADLLDWTKYIGQKVASIPKAIGQSVAEAVAAVFSPDPKLVNEITGAFSAKFGFVETLKHVGDDMFGMTAASEPPVVWIHLEDAEGRYDYGGTVKALDMSWYQRYKEDMDRILGGFLWIAYLWLLIKRAPDIISGAGMTLAESNYIDDFQMVSGQKILARRSKKLR